MSALHNLSYQARSDKGGKRFNYVLPGTSSGAERRKYISLKAEEEQTSAALKQWAIYKTKFKQNTNKILLKIVNSVANKRTKLSLNFYFY